jgi:hypothetical protein
LMPARSSGLKGALGLVTDQSGPCTSLESSFLRMEGWGGNIVGLKITHNMITVVVVRHASRTVVVRDCLSESTTAYGRDKRITNESGQSTPKHRKLIDTRERGSMIRVVACEGIKPRVPGCKRLYPRGGSSPIRGGYRAFRYICNPGIAILAYRGCGLCSVTQA